MRTFKIVLLTVILAFGSSSGFGQTVVSKRTITIGGLTLNNSYTYAQFTAIMGTPDSHKSEMEDGRELITMKYDNNTFYLHGNVFNCFKLTNNTYKLNGVVGVGDPVSKINLLNPFKQKSEQNGENKMLYYVYITDYFDDMSPIYIYVTNGVITQISYLYMDDV